jgi:uncharacterized protein
MTSTGPADQPAATAGDPEFLARLRAVTGRRGIPRRAKDPVSESSIRIWCDAVGDENPAYQDPLWARGSRFGGIVAPAATLNMWTLPGNRAAHPHRTPLDEVNDILFERGFTSVAAVNSDQRYARPLRPGDHLNQVQSIAAVSAEKVTALGRGHFVDLLSEYLTDDGELVGTVLLRMLRWNPATGPRAVAVATSDRVARPAPPTRPRSRTATADGWSPGLRGTIRTVLQPVYATDPAEERPYLVADVEFQDGRRLVTDLVDVEAAHIGPDHPVELVLRRTREGCAIPVVAPSRPPRREVTRTRAEVTVGQLLGPWRIPVSQLSIAALATATFDFNDVHLDRDAAVERGAPDVYMNILGSSALVNCFLTDWGGPEALLRSMDVRLRKQNHPGDALTMVGTVTGSSPDAGDPSRRLVDVDVRGYNSLGDHLTGRAVMALSDA